MKKIFRLCDLSGWLNPVTKAMIILTSPGWILFAFLLMLLLRCNVLEIDFRYKKNINAKDH